LQIGDLPGGIEFMINKISLKEDMHVHSTFSDGINTIEENVKQAESLGLSRMCCVDHVRANTTWLSLFTRQVAELNRKTNVNLFTGIEAKILLSNGKLDVPMDFGLADYIYAADHQFPGPDRPYHPKEIRKMIQDKAMTTDQVIERLCEATMNVMKRYPNLVIAHLFSILPKLGLSEEQVPERLLMEMAETARQYDVKIEIDERWKCPTFRTVSYFRDKKVPIWFSTDSHRKETIGEYRYNAGVHDRLICI
jgi:putative hydrolase